MDKPWLQVTEIQEYQNSSCEVLGLATSGVPMEELEEVNGLLSEHLEKEGINYIGMNCTLRTCSNQRFWVNHETSLHVR